MKAVTMLNKESSMKDIASKVGDKFSKATAGAKDKAIEVKKNVGEKVSKGLSKINPMNHVRGSISKTMNTVRDEAKITAEMAREEASKTAAMAKKEGEGIASVARKEIQDTADTVGSAGAKQAMKVGAGVGTGLAAVGGIPYATYQGLKDKDKK